MSGIRPDGLTGSIMAVESIEDARVILHGPGGCRNYHSFISQQSYPRMLSTGFREFGDPYFFGQPRIPCTYLDEDDYINGATWKIREAIPIVCAKGDGLVVVVNSPGAALIGDNLADAIGEIGCSDRVMAVEESLISAPFSRSYDSTIRSVLEWLGPRRTGRIPRSVNILGLPITSNDWEHSFGELKGYLEAMGIRVLSSPGAGGTVAELRHSVNAECNVVVCPEYAMGTAEYYRKEHGIPFVVCEEGAPVGFDATEAWIKAVASHFDTDPSSALDTVAECRWKVYQRIKGASISRPKPKGSRFAVMADSSVALPLTRWLYGYLSMMPVSVCIEAGEDRGMTDPLRAFLKDVGLEEAWGRDMCDARPDVVLADGHTVGMMAEMGISRAGVDIAIPSLVRMNFLPRPIFGVGGAMYFLDEIFNGL